MEARSTERTLKVTHGSIHPNRHLWHRRHAPEREASHPKPHVAIPSTTLHAWTPTFALADPCMTPSSTALASRSLINARPLRLVETLPLEQFFSEKDLAICVNCSLHLRSGGCTNTDPAQTLRLTRRLSEGQNSHLSHGFCGCPILSVPSN